MTTYACKCCGAPVTSVHGTMVRTCKCNAPIIANMKAVARGAGGVQ